MLPDKFPASIYRWKQQLSKFMSVVTKPINQQLNFISYNPHSVLIPD